MYCKVHQRHALSMRNDGIRNRISRFVRQKQSMQVCITTQNARNLDGFEKLVNSHSQLQAVGSNEGTRYVAAQQRRARIRDR